MNLSHESKIIMADSGKVIHNSIKAEQAKPAGARVPRRRRRQLTNFIHRFDSIESV